ncbi:MAG: NADH:flavin oxidoreductase/NADH oxidase, partial [Arenibacterium sp.]
QRPWFGNGPLDADDTARGDVAWDIQAPSALPVGEGWLMPQEMTLADITRVQDAFVAAAGRAQALGCDFIELHCAHGYLLQTFLSPLSNMRSDAYGGDLQGRMRMVLEIARKVRAVWPEGKPLFARISSVDGVEGGWQIEDSVVLARALKEIGVDVIDCSSGGNQGPATAKTGRTPPAGFQLDYAATVRREAGIATQGVGLILDGPQAEAALQDGQVDLVAIGRQALFDPFWPRHQAYAMGQNDYADWPEAYGWWLERREKAIQALKKPSDTGA